MSVKVIRRFPDASRPGFDFSKWNRQFYTNNVILNGFYSSYYYPSHWTPLSIKCAFGGSEYYITSGVKYAVNDKSYLILNDGTYYESLMNSEQKVESYTVNFLKEFAADILYSISNKTEYLLDSPEITSPLTTGFFEKLYNHDNISIDILKRIRTLINEPAADEFAVSELLHLLLEHMFRAEYSSLKHAEQLKNSKVSTRVELYERLNRAKDYIKSNYSEKVDLDTLSKTACLSSHHFLRCFKEAFGETPHRYLTKIRIEASKEMITNTEIPITEICSLSGFESLSSFGQLFRKFHGLSPEKFRTLNKKQFSNNKI